MMQSVLNVHRASDMKMRAMFMLTIVNVLKDERTRRDNLKRLPTRYAAAARKICLLAMRFQVRMQLPLYSLRSLSLCMTFGLESKCVGDLTMHAF